MEKIRLSKEELAWILYDVGNSAFILLTATVIPIYFETLAGAAGLTKVQYLAYWGYASSAATLLVAACGPALGFASDQNGRKRPMFAASVLAGAAGCAALAVPENWLVFLLIFAEARICYNISLIFYDSMLGDVTRPERFDMVSSHGYAWGYLGSCIPFAASLALILFLEAAMSVAFFLNAGWWAAFSWPLLKRYRQTHVFREERKPLGAGFTGLYRLIREIAGQRKIALYLLSFFFFIDGVYTIIEMATAYGSALGLETSGLLFALLATQLVAFPCALFFSLLSRRFSTSFLLKACILAYMGISVYAVGLDSQQKFWILAILVGMFQGAIQALARSYFARVIPPERAGEYFGIYDICGKGASFLGTMLVGFVAQLTGEPGAGVGILSVLFAAGFILFLYAERDVRQIV